MISPIFAELYEMIVHSIEPVGRLATVLVGSPAIKADIEKAQQIYTESSAAGSVNWQAILTLIATILQQIAPLL